MTEWLQVYVCRVDYPILYGTILEVQYTAYKFDIDLSGSL